MTFSILDVVFILIILIFSIIAATKGFIKELFNKAALIIGILMGCLFAKKLARRIVLCYNNLNIVMFRPLALFNLMCYNMTNNVINRKDE